MEALLGQLTFSRFLDMATKMQALLDHFMRFRCSGCLITRYLVILVCKLSFLREERAEWLTALSTSLFKKLKGEGA